jgi:hypothetical protein
MKGMPGPPLPFLDHISLPNTLKMLHTASKLPRSVSPPSRLVADVAKATLFNIASATTTRGLSVVLSVQPAIKLSVPKEILATSEESAIAVPVPKEILATSEESAIAVSVPKEILATSEEDAVAVSVPKEILATSEEYAVAVSVPKGILATSTILRPYQQECLNECLDKFEQGITRQIVSLPVGMPCYDTSLSPHRSLISSSSIHRQWKDGDSLPSYSSPYQE